MFSNRNSIKLEINNNSKIWKCTNMWKLDNTYLNDQWVKEITKDIKKYSEMDSNKNRIC